MEPTKTLVVYDGRTTEIAVQLSVYLSAKDIPHELFSTEQYEQFCCTGRVVTLYLTEGLKSIPPGSEGRAYFVTISREIQAQLSKGKTHGLFHAYINSTRVFQVRKTKQRQSSRACVRDTPSTLVMCAA